MIILETIENINKQINQERILNKVMILYEYWRLFFHSFLFFFVYWYQYIFQIYLYYFEDNEYIISCVLRNFNAKEKRS